jgi:DNA-binding CsgD family transcriptional regulator/tetratricopeptide (TPR) repeat protein
MSVSGAATDALEAGHEALARGEWADARARFEGALAARETPDAWEGLSRAAWWASDEETTMAARERAYRAYRDAGDVCGAARMAVWLGSDHLDFRGDDALAVAWMRRAEALLEGHEACAELGWTTLLEADLALLVDGEPERAARIAAEALALASALGDRDIEVVGLAILGSALIASGVVDVGVKRLDEAGALAVGERFADVIAPGWALCHTVSACTDVGDFGRAAQWCRALEHFSERWAARHFFGICRSAYGGVLTTRGDWVSAELELTSAIDDLHAARPGLAAPAAVRLGQLRARQGRAEEARRLYEAALPLPQAVVAIGELDLEVGDAAGAADAAERVLRRLSAASALERLAAIELLARARSAAGQHDAAHAAVDEVERVAVTLCTPYMRARACHVAADVLLAAGAADGARVRAEDAVDLFSACSAPYEAARARLVLGGALTALHRPERAEAESKAAREAFALLGARHDGRARAGEDLTPRELDVLRLVAHGLSDAEIAGRLFLSPHTVHRHVANVRTKLRLPSRAAAVAHATRAGLL